MYNIRILCGFSKLDMNGFVRSATVQLKAKYALGWLLKQWNAKLKSYLMEF